MQTRDFALPAYWAPYLANGDASGISDHERSTVDAFLSENGLTAHQCVGVGESRFAWANDANNMGGDVADYSFVVRKTAPPYAGPVDIGTEILPDGSGMIKLSSNVRVF